MIWLLVVRMVISMRRIIIIETFIKLFIGYVYDVNLSISYDVLMKYNISYDLSISTCTCIIYLKISIFNVIEL